MRYDSRLRPDVPPHTGKEKGGPCTVSVTYGDPPKTNVCNGTWNGKTCKPCDKMSGVKIMAGSVGPRNFSGTGWQRSGYGGTRWQDSPYSNQTGAPTTTEAGISVAQYVMGLLGVGVLFFVIGYGYKLGREKA